MDIRKKSRAYMMMEGENLILGYFDDERRGGNDCFIFLEFQIDKMP